MIKKYCIAFFIYLFSGFAGYSQTVDLKLEKGESSRFKNLKEFHQRDGLPNVFWKIKTSRQLRIAYIGGSITEASGGWRDLTFDWFRIQYPFQAFYQINSTIGGTGSVLGVFRIDEVIREKPDLIFVEFAVNDANTTSDGRRHQTMEGIVRKVWSALPNTDICFVYTTAVKLTESLIEKGIQFDAVKDHDKIAEYYGIPSIDMGLEVVRLAEKGEIVLAANPAENSRIQVFFSDKDYYHPLSESGHPVYAHTVIRNLEKMKKRSASFVHRLPKPFASDNWENCRMVFPDQVQLNGSWTKMSDKEKDKFGKAPSLFQGKPGASLVFRFKGTDFGFFDCIGPGSGIIEVTIDGKSQEFQRFDHNCHYWRRHCIFLPKLSDTIHTVEVKVIGKEFDKKPVMKPQDDPSMYSDFYWYPVAMLINGEIIK